MRGICEKPMTTEERREVRRGLLAMGFTRTPVDEPSAYDNGKGVYTETWKSPKDNTIIKLTWDAKTTAILGTVRFNGASKEQIAWGNNDDPNPLLKVGQIYDVIDIEVHSWHTKIRIHGFADKKFNDSSFEWADERVREAALAKWRERH
jgi:hypothetical protein